MPPDRNLMTRKGRSSLYYQRTVPKDLHDAFGKVFITEYRI